MTRASRTAQSDGATADQVKATLAVCRRITPRHSVFRWLPKRRQGAIARRLLAPGVDVGGVYRWLRSRPNGDGISRRAFYRFAQVFRAACFRERRSAGETHGAADRVAVLLRICRRIAPGHSMWRRVPEATQREIVARLLEPRTDAASVWRWLRSRPGGDQISYKALCRFVHVLRGARTRHLHVRDNPRAMGVTDAAMLLGRCPHVVRRMIRTGALPADKANGRWGISAEAIREHLDRRYERWLGPRAAPGTDHRDGP